MIENLELKVFRIVADTLNYRRAAGELYVSQLSLRPSSNAEHGQTEIRRDLSHGLNLRNGLLKTTAIATLSRMGGREG